MLKTVKKDCCHEQDLNNNYLLIRSISFIVVGLIMIIPIVDHFLTFGLVGQIFFALATFTFGLSLSKDFSKRIFYCISLLCAFFAIMILPWLTPPLFGMIAIICGTTMLASCLFISNEGWNYLTKLFAYLLNKQKNLPTLKLSECLEFPSVTKVILLFLVLNWAMSFASFFPLFSSLFSSTLQDIFLVYGCFNVSSYVKHIMQTSLLTHNHDQTIFVSENENWREINLNEIKKDMLISITEKTLLPIDSLAQDKCTIIDNLTEKEKEISAREKIPKNVFILKGLVTATNDYEVISHQTQNALAEDTDSRLSIIMFFTMLIACFAGVTQAILTHSVAIGIQFFCVNLIAACPCIFIVVKAIINQKFLTWLSQKTNVHFNKMPSRGKPNIMVFDRTNTLYRKDPNAKDENAPYILNKDAIDLLTKLTKNGVVCYILSGHDDTKNIQNCKKELGKIIGENNILFNRDYHCPKTGAKKVIIQNLQNYGSNVKPKSPLTRFYFYLKNLFFAPVVGMVGDGDNDISAMQQADLSISITDSDKSFNTDVAKEANFQINQKNLGQIYSLTEGLQEARSQYNWFITFGLLFNMTMLCGINGYLAPVLPFVISTSAACIAMPIFCTLLIIASTFLHINVNTSHKANDQSLEGCRPKCGCARCASEFKPYSVKEGSSANPTPSDENLVSLFDDPSLA